MAAGEKAQATIYIHFSSYHQASNYCYALFDHCNIIDKILIAILLHSDHQVIKIEIK